MRRYLALALVVLLLLPMTAESTGTLTIPVVFGSLAGPSTQNLSLFDTTFNAIRDYINNREITQDTCANRPAAGTKGRYYFCTDTNVFYNDTGSAWTTIASAAINTNELTGLTTATVSNVNQITVAAGAAASDDSTIANRVMMTLASTTQGNTAGTWVAGNFQNKLDAGALGASQTWHIFTIQRTDTGTVDILFSQSATAPTMPTNYTKKRAVGAFKTNAANNLIGYYQNGDEFWYVVPPAIDVSSAGTSLATAITASATVPNGVRSQAILAVNLNNVTTTGWLAYVSSLDGNDDTPSATVAPLSSSPNPGAQINTGALQVRVWTNTAMQYRIRGSAGAAATDILRIGTLGFVYPRRP